MSLLPPHVFSSGAKGTQHNNSQPQSYDDDKLLDLLQQERERQLLQQRLQLQAQDESTDSSSGHEDSTIMTKERLLPEREDSKIRSELASSEDATSQESYSLIAPNSQQHYAQVEDRETQEQKQERANEISASNELYTGQQGKYDRYDAQLEPLPTPPTTTPPQTYALDISLQDPNTSSHKHRSPQARRHDILHQLQHTPYTLQPVDKDGQQRHPITTLQSPHRKQQPPTLVPLDLHTHEESQAKAHLRSLRPDSTNMKSSFRSSPSTFDVGTQALIPESSRPKINDFVEKMPTSTSSTNTLSPSNHEILNSKVLGLTNTIQSMTTEHNKELQEKEYQLAQAKEQVKRLQAYLGTRDPSHNDINAAKSEIKRLGEQNELLKGRLSAMEQIIKIQENTLADGGLGHVTMNRGNSGYSGFRVSSEKVQNIKIDLLEKWRTKVFTLMVSQTSKDMEFRKELTSSVNQLAVVEEKLQQKTNENEFLRHSCQNLEARLNLMETENEAHVARAQALQESLETTQASKTRLQCDMEMIAKQAKDTNNQYQSNTQRVNEALHRLDVYSKRIDFAFGRIQTVKHLLSMRDANVETENLDVNDKEKTSDGGNQDLIEVLQAEVAQLTKDRDLLMLKTKKDADTFAERVKAATEAVQTKAKEQESKIEDLQNQVRSLTDTNNNLNQSESFMKKELLQCQKAIQDKEALESEMNSKVEGLQLTINSMTTKNDNLSRVGSTLKLELEESKQALKALRSQTISELQAQDKENLEIVQIMEDKHNHAIQELQTQITTMKQEVKEAKDNVCTLEKQLERAKSKVQQSVEIQDLKERLQRTEKQLKIVIVERNTLLETMKHAEFLRTGGKVSFGEANYIRNGKFLSDNAPNASNPNEQDSRTPFIQQDIQSQSIEPKVEPLAMDNQPVDSAFYSGSRRTPGVVAWQPAPTSENSTKQPYQAAELEDTPRRLHATPVPTMRPSPVGTSLDLGDYERLPQENEVPSQESLIPTATGDESADSDEVASLHRFAEMLLQDV
eukprot:m.42280 g.42280  ORF g.42280 m.42280 type:complete len:1020 (-) comp9864_c0_seq4:126-3185(-)